jgi:ABC-type multidrug transport system fused ATPase/permease subunit
MFFSYFQVAFWLMASERQTRLIRKSLFRAILRQEIGWFDVYKSGELTNRLTEYVLDPQYRTIIKRLSSFK